LVDCCVPRGKLMHLQEITVKLHEFLKSSKVVFLSWTPTNFDSTTLAKLYVKMTFTKSDGSSVSFGITTQNCTLITNILQKINSETKTVFVGHNFKIIFSLFRRLTGKSLEIGNVFDLGWYESYFTLPNSIGDTQKQSIHLRKWITDPKAVKIYKTVFLPLITTVLPSIESNGLVNTNLGILVFPNFVVEGQVNGRLSCICEYKRCYNPHSLSDEEKDELVLPNLSEIFVWFDYRNMEVAVLAELSNDRNLKNIIQNHPKDVYEKICFEATKSNTENARNIGKQLFLPCVYGQGANGVAKSLDISVDQAAIFLHNLRNSFPEAFGYIEKYQNQAEETQQGTDSFGRVRSFPQGDSFKARNFAVQAPSALLCLESLVRLQNASNGIFKVIFTVHDGYCISANKDKVQDAYKIARDVLQQQSEFLPISLQVSTKIGKSLSKMTIIGKR
jgi:hypothetical protein